jgi:elongation factor 1-beta
MRFCRTLKEEENNRMGKVVASIKILPSDAETDLNTVKQALASSIPSEVEIHKFEEEPIAFGLKALIVHLVLPEDKAGKMDEVEAAIKGVKGVGGIEILMVRRF